MKYPPPCSRCRRPGSGRHRHHITPRQDGGDDSPGNLAPLCGACHREYHRYHDVPGAPPDLHRARFAAFCETVPARILADVARDGEATITLGELRRMWAGVRDFAANGVRTDDT